MCFCVSTSTFFLQKMTGEMFAGVNLTGATGTLAVSSLVELKVGLRKEVSTWSYMLGKNDMLGKVMHWIIFIVTFHHSIYFRNLSRSFRIEKWKIVTNIFLKVTPSLVYIPLPVWPFVGLFLNMYNIIIEEHFSPKFKQWLHVVIKTRMIWLWWSMMARGTKVWRRKMWDLILKGDA